MPPSKADGPENKLDWRQQLDELRRRGEQAAKSGLNHAEGAQNQLKKWRILHKALKDNPFHVRQNLPRDEQWRRALTHVIKAFDEPDISDWVGLQAQVAANILAGIRDLRPRKNGPCYDLLMEFVRDRKRKANEVLRWAQGAQNGHSPARAPAPAPASDSAPGQSPDGPANPLTELYRTK